MQGTIHSIYISESPDKEMQSISSASLIAGKGVEGDRYFVGKEEFRGQYTEFNRGKSLC